MKILLISSYLPYPLTDGGKIRLYNLIKLLREKHEITLVCEKRPNQNNDDINEVKKICKKVIVFNRPKALSFKNFVFSAFSTNSLLTTVHTHKKFKELIKQELEENNFDLIHVETFYVMQNLPKVQIPIVLVEHNIEYMVYEKYAKKASIFIRLFLHFDNFKLKRKEMDAWKKADQLVAVSAKEQKLMGNRASLVPNGVDLEKFKFKKIDKNKMSGKILFIGSFKWVQNRDAVTFIIKNIWPNIINRNKHLKFWVVGKQMPESLKSLKSNSIIFDENASNKTEEIFYEADVLLAPIRVGGGSNFKILEAMSTGTPVVTSSLGNEGIGAREDSEILISDKPEDYVNSVLKLVTDDYLYEKITRNGREFIKKNYDWNSISLKLDSVYVRAVEKK